MRRPARRGLQSSWRSSLAALHGLHDCVAPVGIAMPGQDFRPMPGPAARPYRAHLYIRDSTMRVTALGLAMASTLAAAIAPGAARGDELASLDDGFDTPASLEGWTRFDAEYGWPDKIRALDVGATTPGALHLQPYHSAWVRDRNAPFLFKTVTGDFDVRARVRVRGLAGDVPGGTWSLGGLMARVPNRSTAAAWEPRRENWHFITTGVGHVRGEPMTETKSTFNSYSSLKLRPFPTGWVELRLVRVGMALIALARPEGATQWQVRDRSYRMENNPAMQVGLIAYTTSDDVPDAREDAEVMNRVVNREARTDMALEVDWIRFRRPATRAVEDWYAQVSANPLADPNLTEAELLRLLGE